MRGTLREAWRLELIDAETKERIVDVANVKADLLPAGRHVDVGRGPSPVRDLRRQPGRRP